MLPFCAAENIAVTPYSALAAGRLSRMDGERTKRLDKDEYAKFKYDATVETDNLIINRVAELSQKYNVSMTNIENV